MPSSTFGDLWEDDDLEDLFEKLVEDGPDFCPYARKFYEWTNGLLSSVSQEHDVVSVNQAKLLLQDKWQEWRSEAPRRHSNHFSNRGHYCLFHVYERAYHQLRVIELSLTPPLLFLPPPEPPLPQLPTIYFGEG
jgi:hypothetical protein